ncbi:MAG: hypothetical protein ACRDP2_13565 [Nocardioidaceae bacterium]
MTRTNTPVDKPSDLDHSKLLVSADQLLGIVQLLPTADSVELKLSVPEANRRSAVKALDMDPLEAQIRQVVFFDTADLDLYRHGVVVRARRVQRKSGDTVVKLRPFEPGDVSPKVRESHSFSVEIDAMPGGFVCSGTMKTAVDDHPVKQVMSGDLPLRKVLSKQQRRLVAEHGPADVELEDLQRLGPVNVLKLKFSPAEYDRKLVAELWNYPDGSHVLELSTKCAPADTFTVAAQTREFLESRGVDLLAEQQTKTRLALQLFSRELSET